MATKRHKRRKNNDSFAHLAPSCGYPFVFHLAVLSVQSAIPYRVTRSSAVHITLSGPAE
jgi:hypothetical protein